MERNGGEKRGEGTAGQLLSSSKIIVMIRIQDGDVDVGDGAEAGGTRACWLGNGGSLGPIAGIRSVAFGGTVMPVDPKSGDIMPVARTGRGGFGA